ncbi:MAG: hypothetical protein HYX89_05210 [Chloroflexi bacterium]|nr:hypothetical protein [Chloroflexota bacterium]
MILVRDVFQAKYGKGDKVVALFKETRQTWGQRYPNQRILTDASGSFFTVVTEREMANLAEWERLIAETFAHPAFGDWFARMEPLVESGRREFYNIEG